MRYRREGPRRRQAEPEQTPGISEAEEARKAQLRRLSAAAVLEQYANLHPVSAWDVAGRMNEHTQIAIIVASKCGIGDLRRRNVRALFGEWRDSPAAAGVLVREKANASVGE